MFWIFKSKKKPSCGHKHFKKFGEPMPENMAQIIRFDNISRKIKVYDYSIRQCTECGKRAFSCNGLHLMCETATTAIDGFIDHKITMHDLLKTFNDLGYVYKVNLTQLMRCYAGKNVL